MSGFVKVDEDILTSSLWVERDQRSVFLTALFMAEPFELREPLQQIEVRTLNYTGWVVPAGWYGLVRAAGTAIVRLDGIEKEAGLARLEDLCAPDPDSRSQEFEGRRLARVNGGYLVLNYFKYRDRDHTAAERMRRLRARQKGSTEDVTRNGEGVTRNVTHSRGQSTEAEAEITTPPSAREEHGSTVNAVASNLPDEYRGDYYSLIESLDAEKISAWTAEIKALLEGMHGPSVSAVEMGQAIRDYVAALPELPTLVHFRAFVRRIQKGETADNPTFVQGVKNTLTLRAGEIINEVKECRNPQFPTNATPEWRDKLNQAEVRAVNALGVGRILGEDKPGIVLAQLAKMLGEAQ